MSDTIIQSIQRQLDETNGLVYWSANSGQPVYDAANATLLEMQAELQGYAFTTAPLAISSGADLVALATTSFMIPQYVLDTASKKVFMTVHDQLQDWVVNWKNTTPARPQWIILWDSDHLRVFPKSNATYTYTMCGVPWPAELSFSNQDVAEKDRLYRAALVARASAKLLEFTQPDLADKLELEGLEFQKRFQRQLNNAQGANTLRLRPGTGWNVAQFGDIRIGRKYN